MAKNRMAKDRIRKEKTAKKAQMMKLGSESISRLKLSRDRKIFIITLLFSFGFVAASVLTGNLGIIANAIILSTFIVATPQFFFIYEKYRNLKAMEERFPVFLRDIIESVRSGSPLHKAVISVSVFDYGRLSVEIKKMANQLTWGLPLENVLNQFADRVRHSKRLYTNVKIIREAHISGGELPSTLETIANNSNILGEAEKERRSILNQYVVLMYAICFLFVGIVVAINNLMVPLFSVSGATIGGGEMLGITNPCHTCLSFSCIVCEVFESTSMYIFSIDPTTIASYYVSLFFFMSIIQAIFSGLVAGQIGENSITAGIKHSLVLTSVTFGAFYFLIYFGFLGG